MIPERVRMAAVWLWRCRHSRGFGIQSPWAYSFVRYVLNEHWPYHAYNRLEEQTPMYDLWRRKLLKLYLRLANFRQQQPWTIVTADASDRWKHAVGEYVQAGCCSSRCEVRGTRYEESGARCEVRGTRCEVPGMVVVECIATDAAQRALWQRLLSAEGAGVSFDLYYCGIVFFDLRLAKQHYVVNF